MQTHKDKCLIVVLGPTAVGKTDLSLELAREYKCSILSADARQFYRGMDIGTAKLPRDEMQGIPHYFIDFLPVTQDYSAGKFERDALEQLDLLWKENPVQMLVGGSGLYIKALTEGLNDMPIIENKIREEADLFFKERGLAGLQEWVKEKDPSYYQEADINNHRRLLRAMEVILSSGKPYSYWRRGSEVERNFNIIEIGLSRDRQELMERINLRVDQMMAHGLLQEVENLMPFRDENALQTVGYRELFPVLEGKIALDEGVDKIKINTRKFAKRQMTWFKKISEVNWFQPDEVIKIKDYINSFME